MLLKWGFVCLFFAALGWSQSDRGAITGTITDQAGAVIAGAMIEAKNVETGAVYPTASTETGNYTIPQLPVGSYEPSATVPGFKKYVRSGITVQVAQTLRIDISVEVGSTTESVSVTAEASLLKTESADVSHNVNVQSLNTLPILGVGSAAAGSSGIRNPNNVLNVVPGAYYQPNATVKINGAPANTQAFRVEGMDATNQSINFAPAQVQPSVDAIEEVSVQTSNFAPEFGAVGGGFFNVTMRSGTNQYHGSGYDYFVNEVFNAGTPFTNDANHPGNHIRPRARRNDYGWTIGGPASIPGLYNAKDKTFFFFGFEQFRETQIINNIPITVPTDDYRKGDFSGAIAAAGNKLLGTDPAGRPIIANTIYDPRTVRLFNGQLIADPFFQNQVPLELMDPVALKIQALIPHANLPGALNNYQPSYPSVRHTTIPSVKIDHLITDKARLSFYWSFTHTDSQYSPTYGQSEGLPDPITAARGTFIHSHVERLNYDHTLSPTLLLHLGVGYQQNNFFDDAPVLNYNAFTSLGLKGATLNRNFPTFTGFCPPGPGPGTVLCSAAGGMYNMGPAAGQTHTYNEKPAANGSFSWVKENHSLKFGFDYFALAIPTYPYTNTAGTYQFSANETAMPYLVGGSGTQNLTGGTVGFPYASFLMGLVDQYQIAAPPAFRQAKQQFALYAQDSWKVTRKLTLNYGLRWDYGTYFREEHGRGLNFSPTTPNPSAGGQPGAFIFEGSGPGHCNCDFASNYPYALGPRLGAAYQITPKTVLRAGWGLVYGQTGVNLAGIATAGVAATTIVTSPGQGRPATTLTTGIPITPVWPNITPGVLPQFPTGNQALPAGVGLLDPQAGRPPRQNEWSIGIEREITPNFVVEASYVGNRGVWWSAPSLENINAITPQRLAAYGLDIHSQTDQTLLLSPLSSPLAIARGFKPPYAGFSMANTVAQSLRPFPQFGVIPVAGDPKGKTWYDSLQVKVTKRLSYGLSFGSTFTWQKSLQLGVDGNRNLTVGGPGNQFVNMVAEDPSSGKSISRFDQPFLLIVNALYEVPKLGSNKALSLAFSGWQIGTLLQYGSGLPIEAPAATTSLVNQLFQPTVANRVAGQPLYNVDINCHCYDPSTTFILNPKAWANPPQGSFGSGALFYTDYRYQRHPQENLNFGRTFRFGPEAHRMSLNLRIEFNNVFNRTYLADTNLAIANPFVAQTRDALGQTTGGFGYLSRALTGTQFGQPRNGTLVMRFQF